MGVYLLYIVEPGKLTLFLASSTTQVAENFPSFSVILQNFQTTTGLGDEIFLPLNKILHRVQFSTRYYRKNSINRLSTKLKLPISPLLSWK